MVSEGNGGADGGADLVLLDGVSGCEARVLHGVGGEDSVAVHGGAKDCCGDMDSCGFVVFGLAGVSDDAWDHGCFGGGAGDHDDAALGAELVEDEGHDGVEEFAFVGDARGDGGERVDDS